MTRGQTLRRLTCCFAVALITGAIVASSATGQPAELDEAPMVMTLEELEGEIERREADLRRYSEQLQRLERPPLAVFRFGGTFPENQSGHREHGPAVFRQAG